MAAFQSSSSRRLMVRLSVLGLAVAIWFQGCSCDKGIKPGLTSISPISSVAGSSPVVTLTGTDFITGSTAVIVSGTGVTPGNTVVTNTKSLTTAFAIDPAAARAVYKVNVQTPGGDSPQVDFTVLVPPPTVTSIDPPVATSALVSVVVHATLNGSDLTGATSVSVTGGIGTSNLAVVSDAKLTVDLTIPAQTSGTQTVTVTTPAGTSSGTAFAVSVGPAPTLISMNPNTGVSGSAPFDVTFVGTNLDASATMPAVAGEVQFSNLRVTPPAQLIATATIPANIRTGSHGVTVTTKFGPSNPLTFQVTGPTPVLTSLAPSSGAQGSNVPVRLLGTNFVATGNAVNVAGAGISVLGLTNVSSAEVDATFVISATAALGSRNVSVTAPHAGTSNTLPFDVVAAPAALTLISVTPNNGAFGQVVNVTIVGTGFGPGLTLNIQDVTVSNLVIVDSTHLTATFGISNATGTFKRSLTASIGNVTSNALEFDVV